jgi:NAD(P)H dehydrogenase (quinone)
MDVLAVFCHPRRNSFTGALLDGFVAGLAEAGHDVEVADLYREGFDPRFQAEDYAQFKGEPMPEQIVAEQRRLDRADALAFVFPVWWWSFPAMLKGWIDRVWSEGWAYNFTVGRSKGLLRDRPTVLLGSAATRAATYRKYGYDQAMRVQLEIGTLGYCGLHRVATHLFYEVDTNAEARREHLIRAHAIGASFPAESNQQSGVSE